jgi:hypothetical protein
MDKSERTAAWIGSIAAVVIALIAVLAGVWDRAQEAERSRNIALRVQSIEDKGSTVLQTHIAECKADTVALKKESASIQRECDERIRNITSLFEKQVETQGKISEEGKEIVSQNRELLLYLRATNLRNKIEDGIRDIRQNQKE